jgi:hypothetical protein
MLELVAMDRKTEIVKITLSSLSPALHRPIFCARNYLGILVAERGWESVFAKCAVY